MSNVSEVVSSLTRHTEPHPCDPNPFFRSQNVNFTAYALAANLLRFSHAEINPNGRAVDFILVDGDKLGAEAVRRYNAGLVSMVNPRVLYEIRSFLIDEARRVQAEANRAEAK